MLPFLVATGVLVLDQITKSLAEAHISEPAHVVGPLGLGLTYNAGSAFSLFRGSTGLLTIFDGGLVVVLIVVALRCATTMLRVGIGLMLGGALGNLADRLARDHHGQVVDFITLSHWPTFNLADAAIDVGVIIVIASLLMGEWSARRKEAVHD
jgi:signal peptidase II